MGAANNTFQIQFTIDLRPYKAGLESMLTMTQAAGKQITPLLNMQVNAPEFESMDSEMARYQATLKGYEDEAIAAAAANDMLGNSYDDASKKAGGSTSGLEKNKGSIRGAKREALEMFGALSFLTQNIVQMADSASGGSPEIDKLSRSLSQGISAGFGLASTLSLLGITTGGVGAIIGGTVTVGMALINFLSDTETKADAAKKAVEEFGRSLRGASAEDLQKYEVNFKAAIKTQEGLLEAAKKAKEDNARYVVAKSGISTPVYRQEDVKEIGRIEGWIKKLQVDMKTNHEQLLNQTMTDAQVLKEIEQTKIELITDTYDKEIAKAKETYKTKYALLLSSFNAGQITQTVFDEADKTNQEKRDQEIKASKKKRLEDEISFAEEIEAKQKQIAEEEKQYDQMIAGINAQVQRFIIDGEKAKELATARTAQERVAIEERYALKAIDLEEQVKLAAATSDEERTAITAQFAAQRQMIRSQSSQKFIEAEKQDAETAKQTQERIREEWRKTHEFQLDLIQGMTQGFRQMFSDIISMDGEANRRMIERQEIDLELYKMDKDERLQTLKQQLQKGEISQREYELRIRDMELEEQERSKQLADAKNEIWTKALKSMEDAVVNALGNMLAKEVETAAVEAGIEQGKQAMNMQTAASSAVSGTTKAGESAAALPFPANLVAIGVAIVAASALFAGIRAMFGFAQGGILPKGKVGFFEGFEDEFVIPKHTAMQVLQSNMLPAASRSSETSSTISGSSGGRLEKNIKELTRAFKQMPRKVLLEAKGSDMYGTLQGGTRDRTKRTV